MRLLLISRCTPYPLHLGDRLILYHLAEQLAARGYEIDLLAFYSDPADTADLPHFEQFFRSVTFIREPRRSLASYLRRTSGLAPFFPPGAAQAWSPDMWRAIEAKLASNHYDAVQFFGGVQVYEYRDSAPGLPRVIVPYESYSLYLERALARQKRDGNLPGWLLTRAQLGVARRYERQMFAGYDRVVVLTGRDQAALAALAPTLPLHVIPNGIDTDYFTPSAEAVNSDAATLLFFGNFDYQPNADAATWLVEEIFPMVRQRIPAARLLLVGNNPTSAMQANSDSSRGIEVTGRVPDIRPYLERATLFISPLRLGAGIKNKVLEAMAMGKPVVATPLSCDGIDVTPGTHVLTGESFVELAAAAVQLIGDGGLRAQMSAANRALIRSKFTWASVADRYEVLFAEVLRQSSAG